MVGLNKIHQAISSLENNSAPIQRESEEFQEVLHRGRRQKEFIKVLPARPNCFPMEQ